LAASALPQNFADPAGGSCLKTNPTGADDDERVQQASRHDLRRALEPRYARARRREKSQLLDEFCAITGYSWKYALALLSEVALLRMCWTTPDVRAQMSIRSR
jgi:hypothetical protein